VAVDRVEPVGDEEDEVSEITSRRGALSSGCYESLSE